VKRNLIIFVVALPFIISFAVLIATKHSATAPDTPMPNPNGYDQFLASAGMLQGEAQSYETMSEEELTALVATNAEALALVRSAFTNECRVPVKYSIAYISTHLNDLTAIRNLSQVLVAQGRLAEMQNHPSEAAKDYLDVIHFSIESGRGGFLVDALIGDAIEGMGRSGLEHLVNSLDAASCRSAAIALASLDSRRQAWDNIMEREDIMQHQLTPNLFSYLVATAVMHKQLAESRNKAEMKFHDEQKKTRTLAVQFSARAYELDKGKPPTSITDLVPTYLKAVPQDPTTGKNMVYPP
jgi:hypothetical protein